jgi:O-antigen ligase
VGLSRGATPADGGHRPPGKPSFGNWLGSIWLYTGLRLALFLALWGILVLLGLSGLIAALLALLLSVPLAFVLLARPRQRVAQALEQRLAAQRARRDRLADELDPDDDGPAS